MPPLVEAVLAATVPPLTGAVQALPTTINDWVLVWPVALPIIGATVLLIARGQPAWQSTFAFMVLVGMVMSEALLVQQVAAAGPLAMTMGNWLPPFGISFAADMLGAFFALVAGIVTLVVLVYAQSEVQPRQTRYGFHPLLLVMIAGVNGAFLTGDVFNLYVWFEVMLIASFGLMIIGGRRIQLDGAVKYGFISLLATTLFLTAVGFLYGLLGTLNMADIARVAADADPVALVAVQAMFLLALALKAAAFPVNAWLPASYHTPDPSVSALFAGLLTKVGVYAAIRILVALMPPTAAEINIAITAIAMGTLILGPLGAMAETNLRRALGFLVIGGIGAMLSGIAIADPATDAYGGIFGSAMYVVHSMLTITALYLVAGLIEAATGTRDTRRMGGLYHASSPLSLAFICLVLAISGMPPFLGFWPKFVLVKSALAADDYWMAGVILLSAFLTTIAGSRLWAHIFWRNSREGDLSEAPNDRLRPLTARHRWLGLAPAAALTAAIVLLGLWPAPLFEAGRVAAVGIVDPAPYIAAVALQGGP
jgi:multicomponent Na+:H+ antiporter subunit D